MSCKIKRLLKRMTNKTYKILIPLKKIAYSRKSCRALIESGDLKEKIIKGTTRHKPKKPILRTKKEMWIKQVRTLRGIWRKEKLNEVNSALIPKYRVIYREIKGNVIRTRKKLMLRINDLKNEL